MNTMKTVVLMVGLTVLLVIVGGAIAGQQGMEISVHLCVRDEHVQLLVQRQAGSAHVQRARSNRSGVAVVVRRYARSRDSDEHADA